MCLTTQLKSSFVFDSNFCTNEEEEERPILGQAGKQAQSNQQQKRYTEAKKKSRRSSIVQTHTKHTRHKHRDWEQKDQWSSSLMMMLMMINGGRAGKRTHLTFARLWTRASVDRLIWSLGNDERERERLVDSLAVVVVVEMKCGWREILIKSLKAGRSFCFIEPEPEKVLQVLFCW